MFSSRSLGYTLLRCTIGLVFFFYGMDKFAGGFLRFAQVMQTEFGRTWVPSSSVYFVAIALPFLEVVTGTLLILGLFTTFSAAIAGLLIIVLTTGKAIEGDPLTVAENLIFAIAIFILLHHIDQNLFSVDTLRKARSSETP